MLGRKPLKPRKILITELSQVNIYLRKIESKDSDESYGVLDIHSFINASI